VSSEIDVAYTSDAKKPALQQDLSREQVKFTAAMALINLSIAWRSF
jgi:hypothetical protein